MATTTTLVCAMKFFFFCEILTRSDTATATLAHKAVGGGRVVETAVWSLFWIVMASIFSDRCILLWACCIQPSYSLDMYSFCR